MTLTLKAYALPLALSAAVFGALGVSGPLEAQERLGQRDTLSCASTNGRRVYCDTDTKGGVHLIRQIGAVPCEQGSTWGYDARGVWVDRGCRAEFSFPGRSGYVQERQNGRMETISAGTNISIRTNEAINTQASDGRVFSGSVAENVMGTDGRVALPRGAYTELIVRRMEDRSLVIDLDSVDVGGVRYAVTSSVIRTRAGGRRDGVGMNRRTGEFAGGGSMVGAIIGAIAGGGKGAAIGAGAGAGAGIGLQTLTRGKSVKIPAESILSFRLQAPLQMGAAETGSARRGRHYHEPIR